MSVKVVAAINGMNRLGHHAHLYKHQGKVWVETHDLIIEWRIDPKKPEE